jgi:hypothetical protein
LSPASHVVIPAYATHVVTPANATHFVTPVYTGVQAVLHLVFLVSGFHRNDGSGRSPE